jgi:hypothetical protein
MRPTNANPCKWTVIYRSGVAALALTPLSAHSIDAHTEKPTQTATTWLAPPGEFYPQYIADPRRAQSALLFGSYSYSEIPQASDSIITARFGGRYTIVRYHPADNPDVGWQIDVEGGFFGQFDSQESADNLGWDGVFGLLFSYKPRKNLGFRFGTLHDSAHVGDEYIDQTGMGRIGYTRQEYVAGVSWAPRNHSRVYAESGWAYDTIDPDKPWRVQTGTEYIDPNPLWRQRLNWYSAADLNFFQERDWQPATTLQIGVLMPTGFGSSRYRLALELYHGRSVLGEFSFYDVTYAALGWYYDL